jgi:hypothetical protein
MSVLVAILQLLWRFVYVEECLTDPPSGDHD